MIEAPQPILLYRQDPTRNMARFYLMTVEPTLFGDSALVRCWGRIGTSGQRKIDLFETQHEAINAFADIMRRKLRKGYVAPTATTHHR
ncbi:MAG: WGR domain-containing protein [Rhizobiaceae bacterium]|nr:WGR domain-containing protein [Rhizobiaceae bacterium]